MRILIINAGSSSIKSQLIEDGKVIAKVLAERVGMPNTKVIFKSDDYENPVIAKHGKNHEEAIAMVLKSLTDPEMGVIKDLSEIDAVGHRVVHGGELFSKPVVIDDTVIDGVTKCNVLAPLHNPACLFGIQACRKLLPGVPEIAVFDTAFHQTMAKKEYLYAIPRDLYKRYGIRKYGFHGISHEFLAESLREMIGDDAEMIAVTCHLGQGCSLTAIKDGKSVDTTMGLTPLSGLIMGTRSGDIDPGIVSFLAEAKNVHHKEVIDILNKQSGLLALGGSADIRDVLEATDKGDARAKIALEKFAESVAQNIAKFVITLSGLKQIVFAGGIGENSDVIRKMICDKLSVFGVLLNGYKNRNSNGRKRLISSDDSKVAVYVIPTNEELHIYKKTVQILEAMKGENN